MMDSKHMEHASQSAEKRTISEIKLEENKDCWGQYRK